MTIIGSSNFNTRSAKLDTELGFVLFTRSDSLRKDLYNEVESLMEPSQLVGFDTWAHTSRRVRLLARLLVRVGMHNML
jgi:phosphatidylserine/phosphatidylglycerophosphate/cardiolipin synthase-like enzyme